MASGRVGVSVHLNIAFSIGSQTNFLSIESPEPEIPAVSSRPGRHGAGVEPEYDRRGCSLQRVHVLLGVHPEFVFRPGVCSCWRAVLSQHPGRRQGLPSGGPSTLVDLLRLASLAAQSRSAANFTVLKKRDANIVFVGNSQPVPEV